MGNKVCKACGTVSGRGKPLVEEPVPIEQHTRRSESLEWLNDLVGGAFRARFRAFRGREASI